MCYFAFLSCTRFFALLNRKIVLVPRPRRKALRDGIFLSLLGVLTCALSAQQARWQQLDHKTTELHRQGKYAEAAVTGEEALRVAEATFGAEGKNVAAALNNLAVQYEAMGKYPQAEPLYRRSLAIRENILGPEHPDVAVTLDNLADLYRVQAKYAEAEPLLHRALAIDEKTLGPAHSDVAIALTKLARLYYDQGRYAEAEPLYRRALAIDEKALGPEHPDVASTLTNLGHLCYAQGKYSEAQALYRRSLAIQEKTLGPEHPDLAATLNGLADLSGDQNRYVEAETFYRRSLSIREKSLGLEHPEVASTLTKLAQLYKSQGKYAEAEPLLHRALAIEEKAFGPEHPDIADTLDIQARVFDDRGNYAKAESLYRRSLTMREKMLGPEHPDVAFALNDLAGLVDGRGKYAEAEPLYRRSLVIEEKALGREHVEVGVTLNNLADLCRSQGRYAEAEPLYRRSLAIFEKSLGPDTSEVAIPLNNLAELYREQGKYAEAEPLYRRSLAIFEKTLGPAHPDMASALNNLAKVYCAQGKNVEAEPLYHRALAIDEKALGPVHPGVAIDLNNLATLYGAQGKYAEAEPLYRRSLAILEQSLGPDHPDVATALNNLADLFYMQGKYAQAGPFFDDSLANVARQFVYHFSYTSETERLQYLATVAHVFPEYFSFVVANRDKDPRLAGKMFDVVLWEKGFIGQSMAALRSKVAASGDAEALKLLEELAARKTALATLINTQPDDREAWKKQVAELEHQADELEKELVKRSSILREDKKLATVTWREVQAALKPQEAAVEIVNFPFNDGRKFTGRTYYVALVLKPDSQLPHLIVLDDGTKTVPRSSPGQTRAERAMEDYRDLANPEIERPGAGERFYATFWKPLQATLGSAKTIYLAPDGVLNQVAMNIVPAEGGRLLLQQYDLRIVTNTKDLLRATHLTADKTATLVGNPEFLLSDDKQMSAIAAFRAPALTAAGTAPVLMAGVASNPLSGMRSLDPQQRSANCPERPAGGFLCPLPNTATEISDIGQLLNQKSWAVTSYHDDQALEEAVKAVRHPRVLHLATHGFFLSDQQARHLLSPGGGQQSTGLEDPMLRSGLLLAGADRVLKRTAPLPNADDGVLTAYEASSLDLNGTELVVLSACETGLGETRAGEGVFGLRRAFEVAGAESVLMSMWKVPDRETSELMSSFYSKWLGGMEKHQALRAAQLELRQTIIAREGHDIPYFWGAWVLVGK